jgi:hypothetical protein
MRILPDPTAEAVTAAPPMRLKLADLGGDVAARLTGSTLYLDPTATVEDQLFAIADAARFLATGWAEHGRRVRRLRAVTA